MEEQALIAELRAQLQRAAWRIQYRSRFLRKKELPLAPEQAAEPAEEELISGLFVQQVLMTIPPSTGRTVMRMLIVEGKSEREAADELGISQQAVNKWKRKAVRIMRSRLDEFSRG
ncbi:sigma factor-like helix-turn-helix DNA-binding protein [Cohnella nanjingensis]|uniref:Helix-turn-helix domain-containing protein n=1 Tax=Cohnella nanjingensis TaxID=1387779 RepID=A0A7X0VGJ2_9BACL|nr:sigma factor-like helix-turn-helix DNA-binding protein [Cohnella nanjingensis]MBB6672911.1 helix-turn-helix domain-containing protein [Cohnella nanjingensis]